MTVKNIALGAEQITRLAFERFDLGTFHFRTAGGNKTNWRRLLAFDPIASFVLKDFTDLGRLKAFLYEHQTELCGGYLSYDLGMKLMNIPSQHLTRYPLAIFHAYNQWVELGENSLSLVNVGEQLEKKLIRWINTSSLRDAAGPSLQFKPSIQRLEYEQSIDKIHAYIRGGDFYQLNYTQQLHTETDFPPRTLFSKLVRHHPAEYACYLETPELAIHSLSPELFLHYRAGVLTTKPIKGTRPRGRNQAEDIIFRQALLDSEKEQAELYMITDLLRNDIGQVSEIGSVRLDALKSLNKLPKVWHTYSQISGNLRPDLHPLDALFSMFPGGSITGCPKRRSMEVIDELETTSRGIYTGAIGYLHPEGDFSFNIAIRTLIQEQQKLSLGSGGGITIDSHWEAEWDELLVKVSTFQASPKKQDGD